MSQELRATLMDAIEMVASGEMKPDQAQAIASLSATYIESQRASLKALQLIANSDNSNIAANVLNMEGEPKAQESLSNISSQRSDEELRNKAAVYLLKMGRVKPAIIAADLKCEAVDLNQAMKHRWFSHQPGGVMLTQSGRDAAEELISE